MRTLRDGRRSRAFDNAGPRSACAPCAMDVVPWTQHPLEGRTRRRRKPSNPTRCCSFSCPFPDRARSTTLATSALDAVDDFLSATCACHVLSADLRVNFHPRDASATSRPVFRAQGSMTSWMLTDAVPPPVSAPSAKSRVGQACSMYTSLGLSLRTTRLAVAPIQPNHAGCGNSLSNIKPATVLRLRRAPCSQTSAGSLPPRVCAPRRPRRHISLDLPSRNSFVLQGRDHVTVLLLSRQSINSCSLTLPLALMISITSAD